MACLTVGLSYIQTNHNERENEMNVPMDVITKQLACGFVDLAWIGAHEVVLELESGSGAMIVKAFDHQTGQLVLSGEYPSIGKARAAFNRARLSAVKREDLREQRHFMRHDTSLSDRLKAA